MSRSSDKFFPIEGMMRAGRVKMMVLCFVVVAVVEVLDGSSRRRWDECRVKMLVLCSICNSARSSSYSSSSRRRMSAGPAQNVGALQ